MVAVVASQDGYGVQWRIAREKSNYLCVGPNTIVSLQPIQTQPSRPVIAIEQRHDFHQRTLLIDAHWSEYLQPPRSRSFRECAFFHVPALNIGQVRSDIQRRAAGFENICNNDIRRVWREDESRSVQLPQRLRTLQHGEAKRLEEQTVHLCEQGILEEYLMDGMYLFQHIQYHREQHQLLHNRSALCDAGFRRIALPS